MILAISGTPGTGKTTLAKQIAQKFSYHYIDVTEFASKHGFMGEYNEAFDTHMIDVTALDIALQAELKPNIDYVIDSHFSHDFSFVTQCIVCICERHELKKRLDARNYSEKKVQENLQSEIFDTCFTESIENELKTIKIDCTTNDTIDWEQIKTFIS